MDIVDTHAHVISDDEERYPINPIGGVRSGWSATRPVNFDRFAEYTAKSGVQQAVLVQSSTTYTYDNSYVADSRDRDPARFVGVCTVDGLAPGVADTLGYWIKERGMSGVRFYTPEHQFWLDKPEGEGAWAAAAGLGVPACVSSKRIGLPLVRTAVRRHPDVPVLIDHMLNPVIEDGVPFDKAQEFFELASLPNLYLKFTNVNVKNFSQTPYAVEFMKRVVDVFGPQRIMWGSNFPSAFGADQANPYHELIERAQAMLSFLDDESAQQIWAGTARSLYPKLNARVDA